MGQSVEQITLLRSENLRYGIVCADPQIRLKFRPVKRGGESVALAEDRVQQALRPVTGTMRGHRGKDVRRGHGNLIHQIGAQGQRGAVVHLAKTGADSGLHREATQDRAAKGVDGLDLQLTRRFQRVREQTAGHGQIDVARFLQL